VGGGLTVSPKTITATASGFGISSVEKTYDGSSDLPNGFSIDISESADLIAGDNLSISAVGQYYDGTDPITDLGNPDRNVGTNKNIKINLGLLGDDRGNYVLIDDDGNTTSSLTDDIGTISQLNEVSFVGLQDLYGVSLIVGQAAPNLMAIMWQQSLSQKIIVLFMMFHDLEQLAHLLPIMG
jgi:hypothetical protein